MKKSILFALTLTTFFISCKKEKTNEFTQTDVTGTSILRGNLSKNVVTPDASGGWTNSSRIGAAGVNVSVKVNKNSLYPNSNAQGADIYSGVSDANGNFNITIKTNAQGVAAQITIDGFTGTMDTIINGVTKTGLYSTYTGITQTRTLSMGQNSQFDYGFNATTVSTNPNTIYKIGTAKITGSVKMNIVKEVMTGTLVTLTTTDVAVPNHKVFLNFTKDPGTLGTRLYEVTTDANGFYSFDVTTVAAGTTGFNQNANIWAPDFATTRDTLKVNNTIKPGKPGVYQMETATQNGVYNGNIRNANNFVYSGFTQD